MNKIYLADISKDMIEAWKQSFQDIKDVEVYHGSILDLTPSCYISPANSFGFMDGGIDLVYSKFFGWDLQKRLRELLKNKYQGELLVGQAEIIATNHPKVPYLISAPTMRVPETLVESANAYLATRATLRLALKAKLDSIAFSGMGTGIGRMPPKVCAKQMRAAYDEVILNQPKHYTSIAGAVIDHYSLVEDK